MHRFYVEDINSCDSCIEISGSDVNHIKNVLRLQVGDSITVSDGSSRDYDCVISSVGDVVTADIVDISESAAELPVCMKLFQGLPKGDKLELIIQKAVELGVTEVVPVEMDRSIVKLDDRKKKSRLERYQKIAEAAAKQSRRGIIPSVAPFERLRDAVERLRNDGDVRRLILVPYESAEGMDYARRVVASAEAFEEIDIFIGPEGGFSDSEIECLRAAGASIISLGHRILRTETAGMAILSILTFQLDK